jgi:hypothetical protein
MAVLDFMVSFFVRRTLSHYITVHMEKGFYIFLRIWIFMLCCNRSPSINASKNRPILACIESLEK